MKRGFTLIEVLVTMAIISILAGIMVPAAWKMWENQEVQVTKERLNALKMALVGDKSLVQGGIRTSYGIVGDVGELPFGNATTLHGLKYLVSNPSPPYPNWNGPYLSGFDAGTYAVDAWGKAFRYTVRNDLDGYGNRHLSGEIRSAGQNSAFETDGDDIFVELNVKEVAPTYRMQGSVAFANLTGMYRASITVKFRDPLGTGGESTSPVVCLSTFPNYTTLIRIGTEPVKIPIGKATITTRLYKNSNCSGPEASSGTFDFFVSDNLSWLPVNPPATFTH
jgi:prepilin-type N-terminal cleavage/methylation domain-containing protein